MSPDRDELLLQRNSYLSGARNPLHHWICHQPNAYGKETLREQTFEAIMLYCPEEAFTMVDGSGDTIMHYAVSSGQTAMVKTLEDRHPTAMLRENAVGRTPYEISKEKWLWSRVQSPPKIGENKRRYIAIADRAWTDFLEKDDFGPTKSAEDQIWDICHTHADRAPDKRVLVSLNEANEVARRLTETKKHSRGKPPSQYELEVQNGAEEVRDEETTWYYRGVSYWLRGKDAVNESGNEEEHEDIDE